MPSNIAESLFSGIRNVSRRKESEILEVGISKSAKEGKVKRSIRFKKPEYKTSLQIKYLEFSVLLKSV